MIFWSLLVAGEGPAAHRDAVPGDRHPDHHLRQVVPVARVPEPAGALLLWQLLLVLAVLARGVFAGDLSQSGRRFHLPVGGGGIDENDVDVEVQQVRRRPEDPGRDLLQRRQQEVHRPVGLVVAEARAALDEDPLGHPPRCGQLRRGLQRPLRGQREDRPRSVVTPSSRRHSAARRIACPISSRSHRRSSTHAPPSRRESSTSISPAAAAATARSGSRNREIEATSRARAARSTRSARPKLWITFATGLPVTGCRSLCASCRYDTTVPSLFRRRVSRKYTPTG